MSVLLLCVNYFTISNLKEGYEKDILPLVNRSHIFLLFIIFAFFFLKHYYLYYNLFILYNILTHNTLLGNYNLKWSKNLNYIYFLLLFFVGVMSRRRRRRTNEYASRARNKRKSQKCGPDSPLLQNDNNQYPTTSYASVNSIDSTHYQITF